MVLPQHKRLLQYGWIFLLLLLLTTAWEYLSYYIRPGLNLYLCLILAPLVLRIREPQKHSYRYFWWAVFCLVGFVGLHIQALLFFAVGFTALLVVELWLGKMGWLPAVLMLLLSSIPSYLSDIFTFSLRIRMSQFTAEMLQSIGQQVEVSGNIFLIDGMTFSVDQACMGLNSIITGLILITLAVAYGEQKYHRLFQFWPLAGIFSFGLLLMVGGNQIRMVFLVLFRSPPDTMGHELIGLASLLLYGGLPIWVIVRWVLKTGRASTPFLPKQTGTIHIHPSKKWMVPLILIGSIAYLVLVFHSYNYKKEAPVLEAEIFSRFEKTQLENGIVKLENDSALVYIKPPVSFLRSEHSPAICWRSSGYEMHHIRESQIAGHTLLQAEFRQGRQVLHTAWWFDNGSHTTHQQWKWRWESMQGADPYRLINVTVADPNQLEFWCEAFLAQDWHRH